jgi:hypothetical protein
MQHNKMMISITSQMEWGDGADIGAQSRDDEADVGAESGVEDGPRIGQGLG